MNSRYWTLAKRPPPPWPDEATFALKEAPVPTPGPGQALTRTIYVSLDPYQWGYKRRGEEPAEGAPPAGEPIPRSHAPVVRRSRVRVTRELRHHVDLGIT